MDISKLLYYYYDEVFVSLYIIAGFLIYTISGFFVKFVKNGNYLYLNPFKSKSNDSFITIYGVLRASLSFSILCATWSRASELDTHLWYLSYFLIALSLLVYVLATNLIANSDK